MRVVDVNVLVDAHRPDVPRHEQVRRWLENARRSAVPIGVPGVVASGYLRVVTHPGIFRRPTSPDRALAFLAELERSPAVAAIEPGERHRGIFVHLVGAMSLRGNDVPDAYLAALAIEQGATLVTSDSGFARFEGLRVEPPA